MSNPKIACPGMGTVLRVGLLVSLLSPKKTPTLSNPTRFHHRKMRHLLCLLISIPSTIHRKCKSGVPNGANYGAMMTQSSILLGSRLGQINHSFCLYKAHGKRDRLAT